jgi:hypothetical protein
MAIVMGFDIHREQVTFRCGRRRLGRGASWSDRAGQGAASIYCASAALGLYGLEESQTVRRAGRDAGIQGPGVARVSGCT